MPTPRLQLRLLISACRAVARRRRVVCPLVFVLGLGLAAPGCGRKETAVDIGNREQVLHQGIGAEPQDLDPHLMQTNPHFNVLMALYEGLINYDPVDLHPVPGAAERWEISSDGLIYTFFLRSAARWSNGDPVTAHDFVFSARRILSPALGSPYAFYYDVIKGARDFHSGRRADFDQVGIRALDDHTLRLELDQPAPYQLFMLGSFAWMPVHRATVEQHGRFDQPYTGWTRPGVLVTNGAFTLAEWRIGQLIVVRKNHGYWDATNVRLNAIHFHLIENEEAEERAYRAGQLHITEFLSPSKVPAWTANAPEQVKAGLIFSTYFYGFETARPPFDNPLVRHAFSLALDRTALVSGFPGMGLHPAASFVPPGVEGYAYHGEQQLRFDPAGARRLLAQAGYPEGRGFPATDITFNSNNRHQQVAEIMQRMWEQNLGVRLRLNNVEGKVYNEERVRHQYRLSRAGWIGDYLDPHAFLEVYLSGGGQNVTSWDNPEYDRLVRASRGTREAGARRELYRRAEEILLRDLPVIPLFWDAKSHLVHPAVHGRHTNLLDYHPCNRVWLQP